MSSCAGILPLFDNGNTVLLGKEFRPRYNDYFWMEFGGKQESGETLAQTACRECNEETAQVLAITLELVQKAEDDGWYVDHHNASTGMSYRMYVVNITGEKPQPATFKDSAVGKDHVEMEEWKYFNTTDVVNNEDGKLPGTDTKLYSTMLVRLEKLREKEFSKRWEKK
jgi:8-oxo-dGTP pyrophosphatase MutT (NUDIX family)